MVKTAARLGLLAALAGCATGSLDHTRLRGDPREDMTVADVPVRGFPVAVTTTHGTVEGELLAVDAGAVWVETASGRSLPILRSAVTRVRVQVEDTRGGAYGGWTAAGAATSASHGLLLVFTAPLWLAIGTPSAVLEAASGRADATPDRFEALAPFARYPQGPPDALMRTAARPDTAPAPLRAPWDTAP